MLLASLGYPSANATAAWRRQYPGLQFVSVKHPAPSGFRLGRRSLGIGLDAAGVAVKVRGRRTVLATNPWVGVACRMAGGRDIAVLGIYASPGSRSWRLLRSVLASTPVVCTSLIEREAWLGDGGRAESVLWGCTFDLPERRVSEVPTVFVGGSSDRDSRAVASLIDDMRRLDPPLRLVIADGTGPRSWHGQFGSVRWLPYVDQATFLAELTAANVSWLPLVDSGRAAGQMVLAASLQAGLPVILSPVAAIAEYLDPLSDVVTTTPASVDLLMRLASEGLAGNPREVWRDHLSIDAYTESTASALGGLGWPLQR